MNIYLKVIKIVALKVKRSDTIRELKAVMREKEGVSENFQELFYAGHHLKDEHKLVDCGIQKNSSLHLVLETSGVVKLVVRISSMQKIIEVEAKRRNTIHNIKLMIQATEGIHLDGYTLFYGGKLLENSWTLASLDIKGEAILNLVFNPRDVLSLSVKLPNGETFKTDVKILYTVLDVKEIIGSMVGLPFSDHNLVYGGKQLEDSLTLASYNIDEESILEIVPPGFQIFVKLWSGKTVTLDVWQQDTVTDVKNKIIQKLGNQVDFPGYYLESAGKNLDDDQKLARYGVEKNSTINMVLRVVTSVRPIKFSEIEGSSELPESTSIGHLKELIKKKLKVPVKEVLLGEQAMRDDCMLANYAIKEDTMMTVTF